MHGVRLGATVNLAPSGAAMKILIAMDGSTFSVKACRWVIGLTRSLRTQPQICLVNADEPLSNSVAIRIGPTESARYHKENAEFALKKGRAQLKRAGLKWTEETRIGHPAKVVLDVAERFRADMVVMGSHGRSPLKSLVLGSVTSKVIASTSIPIAVVR
jgi:nucleotide-binding universal stress UspA family protein